MRLLSVLLLITSFLCAKPAAMYLTLTDDPAHSMSVHWIEKKRTHPTNTLFYQKEGELEWKESFFTSETRLDGTSYYVRKCQLDDLEESSYYSFYFERGKQTYLFRTLPSKLQEPLKIVLGGDFSESFPLFRKMNKVAAGKYPDCAILGGDIAYACGKGLFPGKHGYINKWLTFFKQWQETMRGEKGRLIPVAAVVGNHDVTAKDRRDQGKNAFFLALFPAKTCKTYKSIELAGSISLFLLDTGHLFPMAHEQTLWLESALKTYQNVQWKVPVYHLAGYPSTYLPSEKRPSQVRNFWSPLFEKYGVKLAFEHHNHAFKRTYPLLAGKIEASGIVYMGDGCWGSHPRKEVDRPFYIEKSLKASHFSLLTVKEDSLTVEVFNEKNELLDTYKRTLN